MEAFEKIFHLKERLSKLGWKKLLCWIGVGLLLLYSFSGKSRIDLETIAVSANEQYIAGFETGAENGPRIRCFHADGSLAFDFLVLPEISAGGYCTLWFEDDVLCALFYRTEKVVSFSTDGTILKIVDHTIPIEERPPEFSSFSHKQNQYIFNGNEIDVVYNRGSLLGYEFFDSERYLAITPKGGETKIIYAWTARGGITEQSGGSSS